MDGINSAGGDRPLRVLSSPRSRLSQGGQVARLMPKGVDITMRQRGAATNWRRAAASAAAGLFAAMLAACGTASGSGAPVAGAGTATTVTASAAGSASAITSPSASAASPSPVRSTATPKATRAAAPAGARTLTIVNALDQTIWVASNRNAKYPLSATGWRLAPGQRTTVSLPDKWGGRIWGRTGCTFDSSGHGHCQTGDCGGVFQCVGSGGIPATLGEFSLSAWGGMDFYDVSMVDGANLPMYINIGHTSTKDPVSSTGCSSGGCTKPVNCPSAMQVSAGGKVVACETACAAFNTDAYCCRGAWSGRDKCIPSKWPVDYTKVFKNAEPYAYSYAYDDSATMPCKGSCSYRVTFGVTQ